MCKICCVIPAYNNAGTIHQIIQRTMAVCKNILLVDDGSTDENLEQRYAGTAIRVIRHSSNMGKGAAIFTALTALKKDDYDFMIVLDGDGQHFPEDIPDFISAIRKNPDAIIVGTRDLNVPNVPDKSKFGRSFANFWMSLETGLSVKDCQSGYRSYPVKLVSKIHVFSKHYNFETEILTRAAWAGIPVVDLPIRTYYPPENERVSHFRPYLDNFRISITHMLLVVRCLIPVPHKKLVKKASAKENPFLHPLKFALYLLKENCTPMGMAVAAFVGSFIAILPIFGFHGIAIIYFSTRLHLNKIIAFNVQHFFMPPFTPFLCIELGYFLVHGTFLTDFTFDTMLRQIDLRLWEWFLGSLLIAPVFSLFMGILTYWIVFFTIFLRRKISAKHESGTKKQGTVLRTGR